MGKNSPSNAPEKQAEYRARFAAKPKDHVEEKSCRMCGQTLPVAAYLLSNRDILREVL